MARPRSAIPSYRHHAPSDSAYSDYYDATGNRRSVRLGPWNTPESRQAHATLCQEVAAGVVRRPVGGLTLTEMLVQFLRHALEHYRRADGSNTSEVEEYRAVVKVLNNLYGDRPAAEFGVLELRTCIESMVSAGWSRKTINNRIRRTKHLFKWAASLALIPATVHQTLTMVSGLQRGRSKAPEGKGRTAVPENVVRAVMPFVRPAVRAMLEVQMLTGMRPGETCQLRPCDLDTAGPVWKFTPEQHKTMHHGHARVIMLGARAQEVLRPFTPTDPTGYYFDSRREVESQHAERSAARKTPKYVSHLKRNARKRTPCPTRPPCGCYTTQSYGRAISRGIKALNADRVARGEKPLEAFTPHQIRHAHAAKVREQFDLESVRAVLGQSAAGMADHYSRSADDKLAERVAAAIG